MIETPTVSSEKAIENASTNNPDLEGEAADQAGDSMEGSSRTRSGVPLMADVLTKVTAVFQLTVQLPREPKQIQLMVGYCVFEISRLCAKGYRYLLKRPSMTSASLSLRRPEHSNTHASISNTRASE
jgi:hypothetical protein